MHIRKFIEGEEDLLRYVFWSSVHQIASRHYSAEQLNAWAPKEYDAEQWLRIIRRNDPFVAVVDGAVAGYADLQSDGHIDHFFVNPAYARKGVGSLLMQHIHEIAIKNGGISELNADVSLAAEPFFMHHGFVVLEIKAVMVRGVQLHNARMIKKMAN